MLPSRLLTCLTLVLLAMALARPAAAASMSEYFNGYGDTSVLLANNTHSVDGLNGGTGWATGWRRGNGGSAPDYDVYRPGLALTSSTSGYSNAGNLTGATDGVAGATGLLLNRYSYRGTSALTGTVWISFLYQADETNRGVQLALDTTDFGNTVPNRIRLNSQAGSGLNNRAGLYYNGTTTWSASAFALSTTHLVVARVILDASGSNDQIDLWVAPPSVTSVAAMGPATVSAAATADIFGSALNYVSINIEESGAVGQYIDALRVSNEAGDLGFNYVITGIIPEPGVLALLALGGALILPRRARA